MPRAHKNHNTPEFSEALDALRMHVVGRCGFEIKSVKECRVLQQDMERHDPRFILGISTLRRFFNLLPSDNQFSITTLNTLSRYARRRGFDSYAKVANARMFEVNQINWDLVMHRRLEPTAAPPLEALIGLMNQTPFAQISGQFVEHLIERIIPIYEAGFSPQLLKLLMSGSRARKVIVELMPPLSWMHGIGTPIFEAFLANATREEERLYATGVLALHALYSGNITEARTLLEGVDARISKDVHILPATRVMGVQWLFCALAGNETAADLHWKQLQRGYQLKSELTEEYPSDWSIHFCEMAARLIVISGQIQPAMSHLEFLRSLKRRPDLQIELGYQLRLLDISEAWLLWRTGRADEARELFSQINPDSHFPFDRTFGRVFYHALGEHLNPTNFIHRKRVEEEVRSSGYHWLIEQLRRVH